MGIPRAQAGRALALATGHVNASAPTPIAPQDLLRALNAGVAPRGFEEHVFAFFDEVEVETMSDLVRAGSTTYERLAAGARRHLPEGHGTRRWLDERS
ncbi:hypothetical protein Q8W71_24995 [Methylobacterium sp. NEAU 140]|uniref:hypothetical protein n=1 Tax=Methylobacterium sp. NEAU 140 TaxID=3064945 RepID=UPI00273472E1|nr:hypothetical protein [Methylobacterium sp. NEAU 140]MDP4025893.1 hypothetical protein [Methylobacterium sp. NEAU 140]